jgi:hypothetical protein
MFPLNRRTRGADCADGSGPSMAVSQVRSETGRMTAGSYRKPLPELDLSPIDATAIGPKSDGTAVHFAVFVVATRSK